MNRKAFVAGWLIVALLAPLCAFFWMWTRTWHFPEDRWFYWGLGSIFLTGVIFGWLGPLGGYLHRVVKTRSSTAVEMWLTHLQSIEDAEFQKNELRENFLIGNNSGL